MLNDLPEVIIGRSTSLADNYQFQVRPDDEWTLLDEDPAAEFHHMVAQLLFVTSRSSKDIKISIAFLCIQVSNPDKDDWGKFVRIFRYIRGTLYLPLILRADSMSVVEW